MRNGRAPGSQGGFTYIAMLIAVAVIGVGLAATGVVWSQSRQREKEQELLFVGDQFRQAIARYYEGTPGPAKRYPQSLAELVDDQRFPKPEHHLRRIYADPMTGKAEWGLMSAPEGGIMGVYSLSNATPIKQTGFQEKDRTMQGATNYYEWRFFYEQPTTAAPEGAPQPTAAGDPPPATGSGAPGAGGASAPARVAASPSGPAPIASPGGGAPAAQKPPGTVAPAGPLPRAR